MHEINKNINRLFNIYGHIPKEKNGDSVILDINLC